MGSNVNISKDWDVKGSAAIVYRKSEINLENIDQVFRVGVPVTKTEELRDAMLSEIKKIIKKDKKLLESDTPIWAVFDPLLDKVSFVHKDQFRGSFYGKNHHFMSPPGRPFQKCRWGTAHIKSRNMRYEHFRSAPLRKLDDITLGFPDHWDMYKDKDILIVGAGPSAKSVNWKNIPHDYLWTCNEFFHFEELKDVKIDLACMASEIQIYENEFFEKELQRNPDMKVAFEVERGNHKFDADQLKGFLKDHSERSSFFHTRYRGAIGIAARMLVLAILSGAKNVYIVGLDGRGREETDETVLNVFNNQKKLPNWFKRTKDPWQFQLTQFLIFWDHIANLAENNDCSVYNLAQGHPKNVSSFFTRDFFPWNENIKKYLEEE